MGESEQARHTHRRQKQRRVCVCVSLWVGREGAAESEPHQTPKRDTVHQSVKSELSLSCARIGDPELVQPTLVPEMRAARRNSGFCPVGHRELVKVVEQGSDPVTVVEFGDMPSGSK